MRYLLQVPDISCNHCKMRISRKLEEMGIKNYEIDLSKKTVLLETEDVQKVIDELAKIDYPVKEFHEV
ncbi:heavy-metal-associated domain-containing protein [Pseudothermotoga sp. U03pept]|uniref:heavy-metal-associated domain-containing protein n=1 Tax=Pseudothermotoga sp. U03pept TaxID=3447012 RepID=UPI003F04DD6E